MSGYHLIQRILFVVIVGLASAAPADRDSASTNEWTSLGLGGLHVTALAIDPTTPATLYVATADGGVFKSTNSGHDWSAANTGLFERDVTALTMDPVNPNTLYAGIYFACWYPPPPCYLPPGIYKSVNGGESWSLAGAGLPVTTDLNTVGVDTLVVDPQTPTSVYAGTNEGLFKSSDGGGSWNPANTGLPDGGIHAFALNPISTTTLYAGIWGGVYKSTDGAASWGLASFGLPQADIQALAIDHTSPDTVYAWLWAFPSGVYKTTNGGASWLPAYAGLPTVPFGGSLLIDPQTPATAYAGTASGVFKTTNGGGSWSMLGNNDLANKIVQALVIDPVQTDILYAGTYGGGVFSIQQALAAAAVYPIVGLSSGSTTIMVRGWNFAPGATLTVGGVAAMNVTVIDPATLTAVVGPDAPGAVDVVVTNPDHHMATLPNGFIYALEIHHSNLPLISR